VAIRVGSCGGNLAISVTQQPPWVVAFSVSRRPAGAGHDQLSAPVPGVGKTAARPKRPRLTNSSGSGIGVCSRSSTRLRQLACRPTAALSRWAGSLAQPRVRTVIRWRPCGAHRRACTAPGWAAGAVAGTSLRPGLEEARGRTWSGCPGTNRAPPAPRPALLGFAILRSKRPTRESWPTGSPLAADQVGSPPAVGAAGIEPATPASQTRCATPALRPDHQTS